jgi:multicomponent Na+:H+ antiporter subunit G
MNDVVAGILAVSGAFFTFAAAVGVLRMPDVYIRMHASTKDGTLGSGLILLAVAVHFRDFGTGTRALAAIAFLLFTAPVAAHMIGKAAYRSGVPLWSRSVIDDLAEAERTEETTQE